jgi:hypothetical protein
MDLDLSKKLNSDETNKIAFFDKFSNIFLFQLKKLQYNDVTGN